MISVVLVDDQELARAGLHTILKPAYGFEVVGEAPDGGDALAVVARTRPDAVVMDVRMPRVDGVQATRALLAEDPSTRILVLTTFGEDSVLAAALRAGASGFCLKDAPAEDIQRAVRAVAAGDGWLDPAVCGRVLRRYRSDPGTDPDATWRLATLTARELDVLRLIGRDYPTPRSASASSSAREPSRRTSAGSSRSWPYGTGPRPWCSPSTTAWSNPGSATLPLWADTDIGFQPDDTDGPASARCPQRLEDGDPQ